MDIATIRARGKRAISRYPRLYPYAQRTFVAAKLASDRIMFKLRHPEARWIRFRARTLASFAAEGYASQYGQDYYLWNEVFRCEREGFFVDIGGNDPVILSNSQWFERQGWHGAAFDPLASMEPLWRQHRPQTEFHAVAISSERCEREFVEIVPKQGWEHTLSGFKEHVRDEDVRMYDHKEYRVPAAPLADFLRPETTVDLLMIDVEGAEEAVLRGIDFEIANPRVIMVENVSVTGGAQSIREYLAERGYVLRARLGGADDLFTRER